MGRQKADPMTTSTAPVSKNPQATDPEGKWVVRRAKAHFGFATRDEARAFARVCKLADRIGGRVHACITDETTVGGGWVAVAPPVHIDPPALPAPAPEPTPAAPSVAQAKLELDAARDAWRQTLPATPGASAHPANDRAWALYQAAWARWQDARRLSDAAWAEPRTAPGNPLFRNVRCSDAGGAPLGFVTYDTEGHYALTLDQHAAQQFRIGYTVRDVARDALRALAGQGVAATAEVHTPPAPEMTIDEAKAQLDHVAELNRQGDVYWNVWHRSDNCFTPEAREAHARAGRLYRMASALEEPIQENPRTRHLVKPAGDIMGYTC